MTLRCIAVLLATAVGCSTSPSRTDDAAALDAADAAIIPDDATADAPSDGLGAPDACLPLAGTGTYPPHHGCSSSSICSPGLVCAPNTSGAGAPGFCQAAASCGAPCSWNYGCASEHCSSAGFCE